METIFVVQGIIGNGSHSSIVMIVIVVVVVVVVVGGGGGGGKGCGRVVGDDEWACIYPETSLASLHDHIRWRCYRFTRWIEVIIVMLIICRRAHYSIYGPIRARLIIIDGICAFIGVDMAYYSKE